MGRLDVVLFTLAVASKGAVVHQSASILRCCAECILRFLPNKRRRKKQNLRARLRVCFVAKKQVFNHEGSGLNLSTSTSTNKKGRRVKSSCLHFSRISVELLSRSEG
jgi:hypothetical protein